MARKNSTRTAQGAGSIRQRSDGRWEARYTAGRDPGTGKQVQHSVYGTTQKEVVKKLQQIQADMERGMFLEPSKMTVGQWLDIWTAEYLGAVKPGTRESYTAKVRNNIKPALGAVKLQQLKPHAVQKFCNDLHTGGLAPKSVKCIHGILHVALKQAMKNGYILQNPADGTTLPRVEKPEIETMPADKILAFIEQLRGHEFGVIYFVTLFTGMRQSEVLGLSWDCVDFDGGAILVRRQLIRSKEKGGGYSMQSLKNDKPRTVTPAPVVLQWLREERAKQAARRLQAGAAWDNPDNLVFTDALGKHLTHVTVYKHYKKLVAEMGIPEMRFHDLRHTYAVNALRSGDDIKTVQGNLGHHTAAFTLDTYGHVTEEMKRASADRMQQFIDSLTKTG